MPNDESLSEYSPVVAASPSSSMIDFPGRMAGILFFPGCNLRCGCCHNARFLADAPPRSCLTWAALDRALDLYREQWTDAVVLTGGEPTLSAHLGEVVRRCRRRGFAVKLDTNGTRPDRIAHVLPRLDYVALDIKASPRGYSRLTGLADTAPVDESLRRLRDGAADYEMRTTVIESVHDDREMDGIAEWIRGARRWVLQPFVPRLDLPDPALRNLPRTRPQRLRELQRRLADAADEVLVRE